MTWINDWERYANAYPQTEEGIAEEPSQGQRAETIVRRCVGDVADVGGGDGLIAAMIQDAGHEVTVYDISRIRVDRAKARGLKAHIEDARHLPLADQSIDTVVLGEILEHVDNPGEVFAEACRVARERVVISLPLNGWADRTHQWRISLDKCDGETGDPTKSEQIVLTFQRGICWPIGYEAHDQDWHRQFVEGR